MGRTEREFLRLAEMLNRDPDAYRREVVRMKMENPLLFDAFIKFLRGALATATREEDLQSGVTRTSKEYIRRHSSISALVLGVGKDELPAMPPTSQAAARRSGTR